MNYAGKTIWITGASSGIGAAFVSAFHKEGANVILSARREEKLKEVKESLPGNTDNIYILPLDLAESSTFESKTREAIEAFGKIDVLFNNGGISQRSEFTETEMDTYQRLMDINFFGTVALTKAVVPYMIENKGGQIIVTSSVAGKVGTKLRTGYAASKHALQGFFQSLQQELTEHNIAITLLCPGFIKTDIAKNALTGDGSKYGEMGDAHSKAMTPEELVKKVMPQLKKKKEEIVVAGLKERAALWVKRISPALLNKIMRKAKVT